MLCANQVHCSEWSRLCLSALRAFPSPRIRLTPVTAFRSRRAIRTSTRRRTRTHICLLALMKTCNHIRNKHQVLHVALPHAHLHTSVSLITASRHGSSCCCVAASLLSFLYRGWQSLRQWKRETCVLTHTHAPAQP